MNSFFSLPHIPSTQNLEQDQRQVSKYLPSGKNPVHHKLPKLLLIEENEKVTACHKVTESVQNSVYL